jgi:hypothetical protein
MELKIMGTSFPFCESHRRSPDARLSITEDDRELSESSLCRFPLQASCSLKSGPRMPSPLRTTIIQAESLPSEEELPLTAYLWILTRHPIRMSSRGHDCAIIMGDVMETSIWGKLAFSETADRVWHGGICVCDGASSV